MHKLLTLRRTWIFLEVSPFEVPSRQSNSSDLCEEELVVS